MIPLDLLEILRCPRTGQKLTLASADQLVRCNALLAQASETQEALPGEPKTPMHEPVAAALVTEDHKLLYLVVDDIPLLLAEEAVVL